MFASYLKTSPTASSIFVEGRNNTCKVSTVEAYGQGTIPTSSSRKSRGFLEIRGLALVHTAITSSCG
uniref:Uncharacterized protein n=1 Tax=Rhizophora mucronata TaxID=61149 RepID=A0A2P2IQ52_RHIMU